MSHLYYLLYKEKGDLLKLVNDQANSLIIKRNISEFCYY